MTLHIIEDRRTPVPARYSRNASGAYAPAVGTAPASDGARAAETLRTSVEWITPAVADAYLARNTRNRTLRPHLVDKYAQEMRAGNWSLSHQGIAFYASGVLADGQHRLKAIVKTGLPCWVNVSRGVAEVAGSMIDIGGPRNDVDLAMALPDDAHFDRAQSAVAKSMMSQQRNGHCSRQAALRFTCAHLPAIRFSVAATKSGAGANAVVRSVIARAYYTVAPAVLQRFGAVLSSGQPDGRHEWAATALQKIIISSKNVLHTQDNRQRLRLQTAAALRAFIERRPLDRVMAAKSVSRLFPLPEEREAATDAAASD